MSQANNNQKMIIQAFRNGKMKPERYGEYWSEEDRKRLCRLFDEGVGISEISIALQRSESSVIQQLIQLDKFNESRPSRIRQKAPLKRDCSQCRLEHDELPECCEKRNLFTKEGCSCLSNSMTL